MKSIVRVSMLFALLNVIVLSAFATDYHIGAGQTYISIANFTGWQTLQPGDHVYIHPGTYKELIYLTESGTEANPIIIEGVPDGEGNLPVIDGNDAITPTQFDAPAPIPSEEGYGLIFIYRNHDLDDYNYAPQWIIIKNLDIHSATPESYNFTDTQGTYKAYPNSSACIYIKTGKNIVIENNILHDCGNGFDVQGNEVLAENITFRSNHLYDNGRTDARADREHNIYAEGKNMVYEYNILGPMKVGSTGAGLKDRSTKAIIRYNVIYSGGGQILDLVDAENSLPFGAISDPDYGNDWVYGNLLINDYATGLASSSPIHYGFDNAASGTRGGPLQFFNNTVYINVPSTKVYSMRIFNSETSDEVINLYNNVFSYAGDGALYVAQSARTTNVGTFNWNGGNWITAGYNQFYTGDSGIWNENSTVLSGPNSGLLTDPLNGDFSIPSGSPLINAGVNLPSSVTDYHPLNAQYSDPMTYISRSDADDIGAFTYGTGGAVPTCSDGIQNGDETGVDCGGSCGACASEPVLPPLVHPAVNN